MAHLLGAEGIALEFPTKRVLDGVTIGSYPFFREGRTGANFVVRATDQAVVDACADALAEGLRAEGYEAVDGGI